MKASELMILLRASINDYGDFPVRMGEFLEKGVYDVNLRTYSGEPILEIEGMDI